MLYQFARNIYNNTKQKARHLFNNLIDNSDKVLILVYHHILPEHRFTHFNTIVSLKTFKKQIDGLAAKFSIISLSELLNQQKQGFPKSRTQIVLTFDDGFQDSYEFAYPVLKEKGIPACFFISPYYLGSHEPLWDCEFVDLLYNNKNMRSLRIKDRILSQKAGQPRKSFIFFALNEMKSLNFKSRLAVLDYLRKSFGNYDYSNNRCLTWEQARKIYLGGFEIGSHSLSHACLSRITFSEALAEIKESKRTIEDNIKNCCLHFAFPFGSRADYAKGLIEGVKEAGYQTCLLNIHGYNHFSKDAFCFKRIIVEEGSSINYLLG